ncbi:hypothetical protein [Pseudomonas protegens]|uniref:hypothetical protein n=1 Tax=Pseudomonas protegens TaxID=380021 RepID=UPI00383A75B6
MKTELLILMPNDEAFCSNKKAFIDFLQVDSLISITGNTISFRKGTKNKDQVSAKFRVETDKVKSNNERYFLLILECSQQTDIDTFSELSDRLKTIAQRISPGSTVVNMLWDGVGRIYAEKSYPIINEVENLLRRLIARFMLITVGMHWSRDAINSELSKKIEKFEDEDPYLNDLHKLDFIHLSQVLFEKKRDISVEELDRLLSKTKFSEEDKEKILKYTPRSNWEKYFSDLVEDKDHSFEKKWELLYKLRNKVAHNRSVTKSEFEKISGLASSIKTVIEKATAKLGEIDINEEDRELIMHSYHNESLAMIGRIAEKSIQAYYEKNGYTLTLLYEKNWDRKFDFLATKDGKTISVTVQPVRTAMANITIIKTLGRVETALAQTPPNERLDAHIVYIVRENDMSHLIRELIERIRRKRPQQTVKIELYAGHLDEENNYIEF